GEPTAMSVCPLYRRSRILKAANSVINSVTPCLRLKERSSPVTDCVKNAISDAPENAELAGCGRSVGRFSGSTPAKWAFQYAVCFSSSSPCSHSRCHSAKSAYCTCKGAKGEEAPRLKAS